MIAASGKVQPTTPTESKAQTGQSCSRSGMAVRWGNDFSMKR